jgi:hypothetical protein
MKIETQNNMSLFVGNRDCITGELINGLNATPVYIETGVDFDRYWINESTYQKLIKLFRLNEYKHTEIYLDFYDVQNLKVNLGIKPDKGVLESYYEEPEPYRDYWYLEDEND